MNSAVSFVDTDIVRLSTTVIEPVPQLRTKIFWSTNFQYILSEDSYSVTDSSDYVFLNKVGYLESC